MTRSDVAQARLANHRLGREKFRRPGQVVAWLGAVQAQDFAAAKWALGLRLRDAADTDIERAFGDGAILRTHVMRPTWHFVAPHDIRSLLTLTGPGVHAANARMYRRLELDRGLLSRCHAVFTEALRDGNYLTRAELADRLHRHRIEATGQRLAYILMHAELDALICSGPRRGKQFTYALLDERVPRAPALDRGDALGRWTLRYFRSHGPAQMVDFAWWSGLPMRDAKRGLDLVASKLAHASIDGKTYWFDQGMKPTKPKRPTALLLSIYDEYIIAYRDRSVIAEDRTIEKLLAMGNALTSVLIVDGKIAGTWKRAVVRGHVEVTTSLFRPFRANERRALKAAAGSYAAFLSMGRAVVREEHSIDIPVISSPVTSGGRRSS